MAVVNQTTKAESIDLSPAPPSTNRKRVVQQFESIDLPILKKIKVEEVSVEQERIHEIIVKPTTSKSEILQKLPKEIAVRIQNIRFKRPQPQPAPKKISIETIRQDWDFEEEEESPLDIEIKIEKDENITIKEEKGEKSAVILKC